MTPGAGQMLLHYRLVEKIGEGGMGEVWKALDTRLDREVAVKVLPESFALHADRLARFEREAKAVAALAHPNILAVYDFGREGDTTYLVTELLSGQTLRERLGDGPLPPRKAGELARQIARGLAAAHEKGFVHRDLKPENVFVTREGRAKILDFGLAATTATGDGSGPDATASPTRTDLTAPGTVLGTADYMSPEQVRSNPVDHRADLFSFGVLFYEMLAGRRPFRRETAAETMTAILREDAPELTPSGSGPAISPALERVVRRCLEKHPDERFQSASDLAFAIDNALGTSSVDARPAEARRRAWRAPRWSRWVIAAGLLVGGVVAGRLIAPVAPSPPVYTQLSFRQGSISSARFGSDDQTIVFAANWDGQGTQLFSSHPSSPESRSLDLPDAEILSISSAGELALLLHPQLYGGWMSRGTLARMPFGGGAPHEILHDVQDADWSPDGTNLVVSRAEGGVYRLEYPPGTSLYQTTGWIGDTRFSPDGRRIAFVDHPAPGDDRGLVSVFELDRGEKRDLTGAWSSVRGLDWSADGREVWFTAGERGTIRALHAVDLGGRHRIVTRAPADLMLHDVAPDGRVLISRNTATRGIAGRAPGAVAETSLSWLDWSYPSALSEDGKTVLFMEQGEGGGPRYALYLRPTDGGPAVRLGPGISVDLSHDGRWVLARQIGDDSRLDVLPTGPGEARQIETGGIRTIFAQWLPNGRIFVVGNRDGRPAACYVLDPGGAEPVTVAPEGTGAAGVAVNPDGTAFAAAKPDGSFWRFPLDGGDPQPIPGIEAGEIPIGWSLDGRTLYLVAGNAAPQPVYRLDVETGKRTKILELMPAEPAGLISIGPTFVTPDGRGYVYSYRRFLSTLYLAENL